MISSEYIPDDQLVHFQKIKKTIELAYNQVIESLNEKSVMPYTPNIYPAPFMIEKTYTVHARMVRVLFYSIVYPDKNNFESFAIYPTLTLIERLPNYLIGVIGHEIAHILASEGKVSLSKADIYLALRNTEESIESKKKKGEAAYKYFNEPVISEIIKWDRMSVQNDIEEVVARNVKLLSQQNFDRMVFKERLENYHEFIRSKLVESEKYI